jgi:hypothetical protein
LRGNTQLEDGHATDHMIYYWYCTVLSEFRECNAELLIILWFFPLCSEPRDRIPPLPFMRGQNFFEIFSFFRVLVMRDQNYSFGHIPSIEKGKRRWEVVREKTTKCDYHIYLLYIQLYTEDSGSIKTLSVKKNRLYKKYISSFEIFNASCHY